MHLQAGQRFRLTEKNKFYRVTAGKVEVYAVTSEALSFSQLFLLELGAGQAVYPALDEFAQMDIAVYALTDTELEELSWDALDFYQQRLWMRAWLLKLVELPWLRDLADRGDDVLITWRNGTVLDACTEKDGLWENFCDQESILSMLIGIHFVVQEKRLLERIGVRKRQGDLLIDEAVANLLDEEAVRTEAGSDEKFTEMTFIVRCVAQALHMPTDNIKISSELVRRMEPIALARRLMQKGGMQMRLIKLEPGWHKKDSGVMIGSIEGTGENVALIPESPHSYRICNASCPEGIVVDDLVAEVLSPDAFVCYAGFPAKKLKLLDLMKFMFRQCWAVDYRWILLASFLGGLVPLVTPIITETIFQDIIPIQDRQGLATVTQVAMVTSFTLAAMSIVRAIAVLRITSHLDMATEAALWGRLLALPTKFFRRFQSGELAQRILGMNAVKSVVSGEFAGTIFNCIFSIWSIFLMVYYSLKLAAAAVVVWFVYCVITVFIYRRVISMQRKHIAASNKVAGMIQQIFSGLSKFRVQGAENQAFWLWSKVFGEEWKWNLALRWQSNYNMLIGSVQPFILQMLLFYIAVYGLDQVVDGKVVQGISYAEFLAFQSAYTSFNGSLNAVIPLIGKFFAIQPHLENMRPILEEIPETTEDKMDADVLSGALEASHLSFAYQEGGADVIKDVSFQIAAGENIAIVGRSGCGKSTLIRLLLGFEEPRRGAIYYDGQDLAGLSLPSVRSQLGVVLQNGQLMTGDIFTNIVGTTNLTQEDAWRAAEAAGIADDIKSMPMEMQTIISENSSNISGGQRQRILIARALAAKPAIVLFDEATSALDNRTQAIVMESLRKIKATRIVVAHRLSTIRDADRIIVMDDGRIAEMGTYEELVAQNGIFAKLAARQVA